MIENIENNSKYDNILW